MPGCHYCDINKHFGQLSLSAGKTSYEARSTVNIKRCPKILPTPRNCIAQSCHAGEVVRTPQTNPQRHNKSSWGLIQDFTSVDFNSFNGLVNWQTRLKCRDVQMAKPGALFHLRVAPHLREEGAVPCIARTRRVKLCQRLVILLTGLCLLFRAAQQCWEQIMLNPTV